MTVTVRWDVLGTTKTYNRLDEHEVNRLVAYIGKVQQEKTVGKVTITIDK